MGYMKITNLYKNARILDICDEVYALEKVHGTSAHLSWNKNQLHLSSGGSNHREFCALFDTEDLIETLKALYWDQKLTIYGEAYGGKLLKMAAVYGNALSFVAFDVRWNGRWLDVPEAQKVVKLLELSFVDYKKGPATEAFVDAERDKPSVEAMCRGMGNKHVREGIVRPLHEIVCKDHGRLIAKHKTRQFSEVSSLRSLSPEKLKRLKKADEIAKEWCTPMRLEHVLQHVPAPLTIKNMRCVLNAMLEDIRKESEGEIEWSPEAEKAIKTLASKHYMVHLKTLA